jgi:hypothetical protein
LKIGGAKFHIKRAISEMGRAKFREILVSGAQFANFPVWMGNTDEIQYECKETLKEFMFKEKYFTLAVE